MVQRRLSQADVAGADRAAELAKCDLATGHGPRIYRAAGHRRRPLRPRPRRARGNRLGGVRSLQARSASTIRSRATSPAAPSLSPTSSIRSSAASRWRVPTGSSDPFALRRAALGIVKIILEQKLPLSLSAAISAAAKSLREHTPKIEASEAVKKQVLDFLLERARYILREKRGFALRRSQRRIRRRRRRPSGRVDRVAAVQSHPQDQKFRAAGGSLQAHPQDPREAAAGADKAQRRCNAELFEKRAERELHTAAQESARKRAAQKKEKKYREALETISELRPAVDHFFDKVLVMAEDEDVRRNRLALLGRFAQGILDDRGFLRIGRGRVRKKPEVTVRCCRRRTTKLSYQRIVELRRRIVASRQF